MVKLPTFLLGCSGLVAILFSASSRLLAADNVLCVKVTEKTTTVRMGRMPSTRTTAVSGVKLKVNCDWTDGKSSSSNGGGVSNFYKWTVTKVPIGWNEGQLVAHVDSKAKEIANAVASEKLTQGLDNVANQLSHIPNALLASNAATAIKAEAEVDLQRQINELRAEVEALRARVGN